MSEFQPPPPQTSYPQYQQLPIPPMSQPPKKGRHPSLWIALVVAVILIVTVMVFSQVSNNKTLNTQATTTVRAQQTTASAQQNATYIAFQQTGVAASQPSPFDQPTPTTVPAQTPAQIEADYKAGTTSTTVTNLDKDGTADQGKDVHFISKILDFVKDSTGNTAGANVTAPDSYAGSPIQVIFTPGTDITQLNEGDVLEVWGTDDGVFSGKNAYGGTVQEVGIRAQYMFDQTTNYKADK